MTDIDAIRKRLEACHYSVILEKPEATALLAHIDELEKDAAEDVAEQKRIEASVKRVAPLAHGVHDALDLIPALRAEIERLHKAFAESIEARTKDCNLKTETERKPEYNAQKGQLVCPYCGLDCGGFCEPGDHKYEGDS